MTTHSNLCSACAGSGRMNFTFGAIECYVCNNSGYEPPSRIRTTDFYKPKVPDHLKGLVTKPPPERDDEPTPPTP